MAQDGEHERTDLGANAGNALQQGAVFLEAGMPIDVAVDLLGQRVPCLGQPSDVRFQGILHRGGDLGEGQFFLAMAF